MNAANATTTLNEPPAPDLDPDAEPPRAIDSDLLERLHDMEIAEGAATIALRAGLSVSTVRYALRGRPLDEPERTALECLARPDFYAHSGLARELLRELVAKSSTRRVRAYLSLSSQSTFRDWLSGDANIPSPHMARVKRGLSLVSNYTDTDPFKLTPRDHFDLMTLRAGTAERAYASEITIESRKGLYAARRAFEQAHARYINHRRASDATT